MYHFLTLGHDCSPAAALRNLDLREQARKAAEKENQNIAAFQDQLNKILNISF